jgi:hypothetical protein
VEKTAVKPAISPAIKPAEKPVVPAPAIGSTPSAPEAAAIGPSTSQVEHRRPLIVFPK